LKQQFLHILVKGSTSVCELLVLRSEIPSGMCAKLRTVAASNNAVEFTCHDHSIIACSRHIYVWCCSSRTSRSWRIIHLTQRHRRVCNTSVSSNTEGSKLQPADQMQLAKPFHPAREAILPTTKK